jgi:hypothetical protein
MYDFTPTATDADGDTLTFQLSSLPTGATFSATTGRLRWMPTATQVGTNVTNIVMTVSDGGRTAALPAFSITVMAAPNQAPTITGTPSTAVQAGRTYDFAPTGRDPEGATLIYSIAGMTAAMDSWADFNTATGRLTGAPTTANLGTYSRIVITVSDGTLTASLPAFSIIVTAAGNNAPTISGTPATTAVIGQAYVPFVPTASDADGNILTFSITNMPSWATFNAANGSLSGTPPVGAAGVYPGIVISVNDGQATVSLPVFTITVSQIGTGVATLSWMAPTMNTNNTPLMDLAGYRIYYGTNQSSLMQETSIDVPVGLLSQQITNLNSGLYYFAVTARNSAGVESDLSSIVSKTIQ